MSRTHGNQKRLIRFPAVLERNADDPELVWTNARRHPALSGVLREGKRALGDASTGGERQGQ
jgi:hypothetical protein